MKQTIGNACGTIGLLHVAGTVREKVEIKPDSYLANLFSAIALMSPDDIANYLEADESLEETHTSAANEGQSEQVEDMDSVDNHFVCFR
jgi:ubiquitin carboxyl-terminal hydrolase L3